MYLAKSFKIFASTVYQSRLCRVLGHDACVRFVTMGKKTQASVSNDADVLAAINADRYPDGQEVTLEAMFGNSLTFDESGKVSGARAMMQVGGR